MGSLSVTTGEIMSDSAIIRVDKFRMNGHGRNSGSCDDEDEDIYSDAVSTNPVTPRGEDDGIETDGGLVKGNTNTGQEIYGKKTSGIDMDDSKDRELYGPGLCEDRSQLITPNGRGETIE